MSKNNRHTHALDLTTTSSSNTIDVRSALSVSHEIETCSHLASAGALTSMRMAKMCDANNELYFLRSYS